MLETTETAQDLLDARKRACIKWEGRDCFRSAESEKWGKEEKAKNPYHIGDLPSYDFSAFHPSHRGRLSYGRKEIEEFKTAVIKGGYKWTKADITRLKTGKKNEIDSVLTNFIFANQNDNFLLKLPPSETGFAASGTEFLKIGNLCYNFGLGAAGALFLRISIFSKSSRTLTLVIQLSTHRPDGVNMAYLRAVLPFDVDVLYSFTEKNPDVNFQSINPDSIKHLLALRECLLTNEPKNIHQHAADLISSIRKRRAPVKVKIGSEKKEKGDPKKEEEYYDEKPARDVDYFCQVIQAEEKEGGKGQDPYEKYPHNPFEVAAKLQAIQTFSLNMTSEELTSVLVEHFRYVLKDKKQVKAIKMSFLSPFITKLWSVVVDCKKIERPGPDQGKWEGTRSIKPIICEIIAPLLKKDDVDEEEAEATPLSLQTIFEKLKPLLVVATEEAIRLTKEKVERKPMVLAEETSRFTKVDRAISAFWNRNSFSQKSGEKESLEKNAAAKQNQTRENYIILPSSPSLSSLQLGASNKKVVATVKLKTQ